MDQNGEVFTEIVNGFHLQALVRSGAKIHAVMQTGWRGNALAPRDQIPEYALMYSLPEAAQETEVSK